MPGEARAHTPFTQTADTTHTARCASCAQRWRRVRGARGQQSRSLLRTCWMKEAFLASSSFVDFERQSNHSFMSPSGGGPTPSPTPGPSASCRPRRLPLRPCCEAAIAPGGRGVGIWSGRGESAIDAGTGCDFGCVIESGGGNGYYCDVSAAGIGSVICCPCGAAIGSATSSGCHGGTTCGDGGCGVGRGPVSSIGSCSVICGMTCDPCRRRPVHRQPLHHRRLHLCTTVNKIKQIGISVEEYRTILLMCFGLLLLAALERFGTDPLAALVFDHFPVVGAFLRPAVRSWMT